MGAMVMARRQRQRVNVLAVEEIARRGFGQGHDGRERSPAMRLLKLTTRSMSIAPAGAGGKVEIGMMDVAAALGMSSPSHFEVQANEVDIPPSPYLGFEAFYNAIPAPERIVVPKLRKLSEQAYDFALAKYLDDGKAKERSYFHAWTESLLMAQDRGWKILVGKETFRHASKLAMAQVLEEAAMFHCHRCDGTGANRKGMCAPCGGSGRRVISQAAFAEFLEIDRANYQRVWDGRVKAIVSMIKSWDQEALQHLYHQFRREGV